MKKHDKNPQINVCSINNIEYLHFRFKGELSYEDALNAIEEWQEYFKDNANKQIPIVWNCLEMTGYKPLARTAWQAAIKEMRGQMDIIWLVTSSKLIQAGAMLMSMVSSMTIKTVKKEEDIDIALLRSARAIS